jgi:hypothetical protein
MNMTSMPLNISSDFVKKLQRLDFTTLIEFFIMLLELYRPGTESTVAKGTWRKVLQQLLTFVEKELQHVKEEDTPDIDQTWLEFIENIDQYAVDLGPEDFSINHEYYLYGGTKRS